MIAKTPQHIRPMTVAEMLDLGFRFLREHFLPLTGMTAVVIIPYHLLAWWARTLGMFAAIFAGLALLLIFMVASQIASGGVTQAVADIYLGKPVRVRESYAVSLKVFWPLFGTAILSGLVIIIGLTLCLVPGIYFSLCYMVVTPIVILEGHSGMDALNRSKLLTEGNRWRGLGLLGLVTLLNLELIISPQLLFAFSPLLSALVLGVLLSVIQAFSATVIALFYFDLRCRKEGFDVEYLSRLLGQNSDSATAPVPG